MLNDYDWRFDRDHDGKLDFFERYERYDFEDYVNKRGLYEEPDALVKYDLYGDDDDDESDEDEFEDEDIDFADDDPDNDELNDEDNFDDDDYDDEDDF